MHKQLVLHIVKHALSILAHHFQRIRTVVGKQRIRKGQQRIHIVLRQMAIAPTEAKINLWSQEQFVQHTEVEQSRVAFHATAGVQ